MATGGEYLDLTVGAVEIHGEFGTTPYGYRSTVSFNSRCACGWKGTARNSKGCTIADVRQAMLDKALEHMQAAHPSTEVDA